jgi:hypothetical protein
MAGFPTSVDDLIDYVERLHPDGTPLDYLGQKRQSETSQ